MATTKTLTRGTRHYLDGVFFEAWKDGALETKWVSLDGHVVIWRTGKSFTVAVGDDFLKSGTGLKKFLSLRTAMKAGIKQSRSV